MSTILRCIIVDDEEGAHLVLEHFVKKMNSLEVCGSFFNAIEAIEYIHKNPVDLVFLDINMPGFSGMDMLASMSTPPLVVLTTAYSEYALAGYKYQVVDYLVKPIDFSAFVAAIDKVFSRTKPVTLSSARLPKVLSLKVDGYIIKIDPETITYIQSWGNYVKVHTTGKLYLSPITTLEIEQKLDKTRFRRIHKSYIVALSGIDRITGTQVILKNSVSLPIGSTFKRELLELFK